MPARGGRVAGAAAALVVLGAVGLAARAALTVDNEPPSQGGARTLRAERVAVLPDRGILVAGVSMAARAADRSRDCEGTVTVLALDARGRVPRDFGTRGAAHVRASGNDCATAVNDLVRRPDGRLLVGATIAHPGTSALEDDSSQSGRVTRLTARGTRDPSFRDELRAFRVAVAADGSIFDDTGSRYLPDGDGDPRDERAPVRLAIEPVVVGAQAGGRKLFLGLAERASDRRIAVQRFDVRWRPDRTFGTDGVATADIAPGRIVDAAPEVQRVVPVRGGGVVAFGLGFLPRSYAFAIKFDRAGRLDRGFGDRGRLALGAAETEEIHDLAARPDGRLLALGSRGERSRRVFVAGYTAAGKPDLGFRARRTRGRGAAGRAARTRRAQSQPSQPGWRDQRRARRDDRRGGVSQPARRQRRAIDRVPAGPRRSAGPRLRPARRQARRSAGLTRRRRASRHRHHRRARA